MLAACMGDLHCFTNKITDSRPCLLIRIINEAMNERNKNYKGEGEKTPLII